MDKLFFRLLSWNIKNLCSKHSSKSCISKNVSTLPPRASTTKVAALLLTYYSVWNSLKHHWCQSTFDLTLAWKLCYYYTTTVVVVVRTPPWEATLPRRRVRERENPLYSYCIHERRATYNYFFQIKVGWAPALLFLKNDQCHDRGTSAVLFTIMNPLNPKREWYKPSLWGCKIWLCCDTRKYHLLLDFIAIAKF